MASLSAWSLIFGGCCSNVFTLESIVKHEPDSGLVITVTQLILTTLFALPTQLERTSTLSSSTNKPRSYLPWRLRTPNIPMDRLAFQALMFFVINMLNNWAFAFNISVPMHIILRSFGSVQTLAVGWLMGKKYSKVQVGAVAALTVGVVVSAWADASAKGANLSLIPSSTTTSTTEQERSSNYASGLLILFTAQLISAWMGIYTESTYAAHGRHWREILFYSHLLGLFFSVAFYKTLLVQLRRLLAGPPATIPALLRENSVIAPALGVLQKTGIVSAGAAGTVSKSVVLLLLNGVTQVACISGVNLLSAQTSAVTVTVVLNIRKLVSFLLSCLLFGTKLDGLMMLGAGLVFVSGAVYGWDETRRRAAKKNDGGGGEKSREIRAGNGTLKKNN